MKTIEEIQSGFNEDIVHKGSLLLLRGQAALEYIEECVKEGFLLIGADAFFLREDGGVQPTQVHELEFNSTRYTQELFINFAKTRIESACRDNPDLWFELDFVSRDEIEI